MVGDDHKCSRKSQSHVEEENNISKVLDTKASKHEELIQIHDKNGKKKVNEMDVAASSKEIMTVMKRMTELEEKMTNMDNQSTIMPHEKEELLSATISRANVLEQQLMVTKKALEDSLAKQEELLANIKKKKKKRNCCFW